VAERSERYRSKHTRSVAEPEQSTCSQTPALVDEAMSLLRAYGCGTAPIANAKSVTQDNVSLCAVPSGNTELVRLLIEAGARISARPFAMCVRRWLFDAHALRSRRELLVW
jgi:hypothetical protein